MMMRWSGLLQIENAFAGEIGAGIEAGNCRQRRLRSSRYHEAAGTDLDIAGDDCIAVLELRLRVDDANAKTSETFSSIGRRNGRDNRVNVSKNARKIHDDIPHIDTENFCAPCRFGTSCCGQQGVSTAGNRL